MGFDPAIVLFGAMVLFLVAILVGVIVVALWPWKPPNAEESIIPDADKFSGRLAAISQQLATLKAEMDHLDGEVELLREERDQLRTVLARVAELLEQFPRIGGA